MNNLVVIKSFQNGISLHIEPDVDFKNVLDEIAVKFAEAKHFFRDAKVALSIEGRVLSVEEEKEIIRVIAENSNVKILCLVGKNEETNQKYIKALKRVDAEKEENAGRFYKGNLKDGQVLETESSIVIIGNVEKGAAVIATKDIIVIGNLQGEVYAGAGGEEGHFVVALQMEPQKCKIGDFRLRTKEKGLWARKTKNQPQIVYCKDEQLVVETITKELLDEFIL